MTSRLYCDDKGLKMIAFTERNVEILGLLRGLIGNLFYKVTDVSFVLLNGVMLSAQF